MWWEGSVGEIMRIYTIRSEWDIGEQGYAYLTKELAEKALRENPNIQEILDDEDCTLSELFDQGLVGFTRIELVE